MNHTEAFCGAKLALLTGSRVLTMLRDDRPDIPFPNHWDLPGGGREGTESPVDCALRELHEEFGLTLDASALTWRRLYPPQAPSRHPSWFFAAQLPGLKPAHITFGDEGQSWRLMPVRLFLMDRKTVPHQAEWLATYLEHVRLTAR